MAPIACPQCGTSVVLPDDGTESAACPQCGTSVLAENADRSPPSPTHWWENSISMLVSIVFHAALMLVLALLSYGGSGIAGSGTDVLIGQMRGETLSESQDAELSGEAVERSETASTDMAEQLEEVQPSSSAPTESGAGELLAATAPSSSGGSAGGLEFDVALPGASGAGGSGGSFEGMIQTLRRNGLDIVIVFDSTGSMGGEIDQVKQQIERIGKILFKLVPDTQISLCTYRDEGDDYEVRGIPLTDDLQQVIQFLDTVYADAGGDLPEAVHTGLNWAVRQNQFRPRARKIILLFGDAPPHDEYLQRCLQIAADFHRTEQGLVSTVTCRGAIRLHQFVDIAKAGGGEAFMTSDERQIMTQLMVLVFGSKHKQKVIEAFRLMER